MKLTGGLIEVHFKPGDFLFHEKESSFHFFILQEGKVEVFRTAVKSGAIDAKSEKIPLAIIEEGQSLGEFAMIDRQPRSASAQALTSVRAIKVPEAVYEQMLTQLPDWAQAVLQGLVNRVRQSNDIIRRHGVVDENLIREIEAVEFDPDAVTIVTFNDEN